MRNTEFLEFAGVAYIINFEALESLLVYEQTQNNGKVIETETTQNYDAGLNPVSTTVVTREFQRGKEIDMSKYEMIKFMLDIVLAENEEMDDSLGMQRALGGAPISFKIAFNTLVRYGVLTEIK